MSLFVEHSVWAFFILTLLLGGGAAFKAGSALARGWKSIPLLVIYMLIFTAGVRFLHYALFEGSLTSPLYYVSHGLIIMVAALLGYRVTRVSQMTSQYPWLYERSGPLSWRNKG